MKVTAVFVRSHTEGWAPLRFHQTDGIEWRQSSRARPSGDGRPQHQPLTIHRPAPYTPRARSPRTLLFPLCESAGQSLRTPHRWQLQDVPHFLTFESSASRWRFFCSRRSRGVIWRGAIASFAQSATGISPIPSLLLSPRFVDARSVVLIPTAPPASRSRPPAPLLSPDSSGT